MKEQLFERDYTSLETFDAGLRYDGLENSNLKMMTEDEQAHVFLPERYAFYKKCLQRMDRYALRRKGEIRGVFSPERYVGEIRVTVARVSFEDMDDMEDLLLVASRSDAVYVEEDRGRITFCIVIRCFLPVASGM